MESETKLAVSRKNEQESKRPSDKMKRAKVEALSEDEEVITVRAPIAKLIGEA